MFKAYQTIIAFMPDNDDDENDEDDNYENGRMMRIIMMIMGGGVGARSWIGKLVATILLCTIFQCNFWHFLVGVFYVIDDD